MPLPVFHESGPVLESTTMLKVFPEISKCPARRVGIISVKPFVTDRPPLAQVTSGFVWPIMKFAVSPFTRTVMGVVALKLPLIVIGARFVLGTNAAKSTSSSEPADEFKSEAFVHEPPAEARTTPTAPALTVMADAPEPVVENINLPLLTVAPPLKVLMPESVRLPPPAVSASVRLPPLLIRAAA